MVDTGMVDTGMVDDSTGANADVDAFRFTSMNIRDPHFFVLGLGILCTDVTDSTPTGDASINEQFNTAINSDDPMMPDGNLDLSLLLLFRGLDQADGASGQMDFANGDCLIPADNTVCNLKAGSELEPSSYTAMASGTCHEADPTHLSSEGYTPAPGSTAGPCFHAGPSSVTIVTSAFNLPLADAEIAGTFVGDPADEFMSGTLRGFLTTEVANSTVLPPDLQDSTGAMTIGELIPGGMNNCADHDDTDGAGWWFYVDFTAQRVPWQGP
jgi:hypothetical protein